jgi:hypothetical protein
MFNGLIDLTQVQPQRGYHHRRTEQDIANKKMEHQWRENKEYNLQLQDYYRQREEQRDAAFAQQQEVLQVSMMVNNQLSENWTLNLYY